METTKEKPLNKTSDEFGTPWEIFNELNRRYRFTVDAAATRENTKIPYHFWTKEDDALKQDWSGQRVFCNPPYSKGFVPAFIKKAMEETERGCEVVVFVIPTRTEQLWFHNLLRSGRADIKFFRRRIRFIGGKDDARDTHMMVVIWPPSELF